MSDRQMKYLNFETSRENLTTIGTQNKFHKILLGSNLAETKNKFSKDIKLTVNSPKKSSKENYFSTPSDSKKAKFLSQKRRNLRAKQDSYFSKLERFKNRNSGSRSILERDTPNRAYLGKKRNLRDLNLYTPGSDMAVSFDSIQNLYKPLQIHKKVRQNEDDSSILGLKEFNDYLEKYSHTLRMESACGDSANLSRSISRECFSQFSRSPLKQKKSSLGILKHRFSIISQNTSGIKFKSKKFRKSLIELNREKPQKLFGVNNFFTQNLEDFEEIESQIYSKESVQRANLIDLAEKSYDWTRKSRFTPINKEKVKPFKDIKILKIGNKLDSYIDKKKSKNNEIKQNTNSKSEKIKKNSRKPELNKISPKMEKEFVNFNSNSVCENQSKISKSRKKYYRSQKPNKRYRVKKEEKSLNGKRYRTGVDYARQITTSKSNLSLLSTQQIKNQILKEKKNKKRRRNRHYKKKNKRSKNKEESEKSLSCQNKKFKSKKIEIRLGNKKLGVLEINSSNPEEINFIKKQKSEIASKWISDSCSQEMETASNIETRLEFHPGENGKLNSVLKRRSESYKKSIPSQKKLIQLIVPGNAKSESKKRQRIIKHCQNSQNQEKRDASILSLKSGNSNLSAEKLKLDLGLKRPELKKNKKNLVKNPACFVKDTLKKRNLKSKNEKMRKRKTKKLIRKISYKPTCKQTQKFIKSGEQETKSCQTGKSKHFFRKDMKPFGQLLPDNPNKTRFRHSTQLHSNRKNILSKERKKHKNLFGSLISANSDAFSVNKSDNPELEKSFAIAKSLIRSGVSQNNRKLRARSNSKSISALKREHEIRRISVNSKISQKKLFGKLRNSLSKVELSLKGKDGSGPILGFVKKNKNFENQKRCDKELEINKKSLSIKNPKTRNPKNNIHHVRKITFSRNFSKKSMSQNEYKNLYTPNFLKKPKYKEVARSLENVSRKTERSLARAKQAKIKRRLLERSKKSNRELEKTLKSLSKMQPSKLGKVANSTKSEVFFYFGEKPNKKSIGVRTHDPIELKKLFDSEQILERKCLFNPDNFLLSKESISNKRSLNFVNQKPKSVFHLDSKKSFQKISGSHSGLNVKIKTLNSTEKQTQNFKNNLENGLKNRNVVCKTFSKLEMMTPKGNRNFSNNFTCETESTNQNISSIQRPNFHKKRNLCRTIEYQISSNVNRNNKQFGQLEEKYSFPNQDLARRIEGNRFLGGDSQNTQEQIKLGKMTDFFQYLKNKSGDNFEGKIFQTETTIENPELTVGNLPFSRIKASNSISFSNLMQKNSQLLLKRMDSENLYQTQSKVKSQYLQFNKLDHQDEFEKSEQFNKINNSNRADKMNEKDSFTKLNQMQNSLKNGLKLGQQTTLLLQKNSILSKSNLKNLLSDQTRGNDSVFMNHKNSGFIKKKSMNNFGEKNNKQSESIENVGFIKRKSQLSNELKPQDKTKNKICEKQKVKSNLQNIAKSKSCLKIQQSGFEKFRNRMKERKLKCKTPNPKKINFRNFLGQDKRLKESKKSKRTIFKKSCEVSESFSCTGVSLSSKNIQNKFFNTPNSFAKRHPASFSCLHKKSKMKDFLGISRTNILKGQRRFERDKKNRKNLMKKGGKEKLLSQKIRENLRRSSCARPMKLGTSLRRMKENKLRFFRGQNSGIGVLNVKKLGVKRKSNSSKKLMFEMKNIINQKKEQNSVLEKLLDYIEGT